MFVLELLCERFAPRWDRRCVIRSHVMLLRKTAALDAAVEEDRLADPRSQHFIPVRMPVITASLIRAVRKQNTCLTF